MFNIPVAKRQLPTAKRSLHVLATKQRYSNVRLILAVVLLLAACYYYKTHSSIYLHQEVSTVVDVGKVLLNEQLEHHAATLYDAEMVETEECSQRHGLRYLTDMAATGRSYCEPSSEAPQLSCFSSDIRRNHRDTFCMSSHMTVSLDGPGFDLACQLRNWTTSPDLENTTEITKFHDYAQEMGAKHIFDQHVNIVTPNNKPSCLDVDSASHTILVKREDPLSFWLSLLDIFSYTMTIDTLRMSTNNQGGPLYEAKDTQTTQVIIIDELQRGPFLGLWHLLAPMPIIFLNELKDSNATCFKNVIIPLPGASNPLREETTPTSCTASKTLAVFIRRLFEFYHLSSEERKPSSPITVTFVDRKTSRKLVDAQKLLVAVKQNFHDVEIKMADLANMNLRDQLSMMRQTDILVGVHGSGLAHAMFLPPGSAVVEILTGTPSTKPRQYRNLARLAGHQYFSMTGTISSSSSSGGGGGSTTENDAKSARDNKRDSLNGETIRMDAGEVRVDEEGFVEVLKAAVRGTFHRGSLVFDSV